MRLTVLLAVLLYVAALAACAHRSLRDLPPLPAAIPVEEATRGESIAATTLAEAQRRLNNAELELLVARSSVSQAKVAETTARREAVLAPLRRVAGITAATALVGLLASIALWFILPAGTKKAAVIGAGSCLAVLACAVAIHSFLPYLAIAGGVLVVGGVTWLIWRLYRTQVGMKEAAGHGERLEGALRSWKGAAPSDVDDLLEGVKAVSSREQDRLGVRKLIAGVRGKPLIDNPKLQALEPQAP